MTTKEKIEIIQEQQVDLANRAQAYQNIGQKVPNWILESLEDNRKAIQNLILNDKDNT